MEQIIKSIAIFCLLVFLGATPSFAEKTILMASLYWPPYAGPNLPGNGANIVVAKEAFKAMGYTLEVKFYPWARAISQARRSDFEGYIPEYYAEKIEKDFIFSDSIGDSPLGFVQRKDDPISWMTLDDLSNAGPIGVVRGYVNSADFDMMISKGLIVTEPVVSDLINLKKLVAKRIRLAVIDEYVFHYLQETDSSLKDSGKQLEFNTRLLENKKLFLCFHKDDRGKELVKIFNQGLKQIDYRKITADYFKTEL